MDESVAVSAGSLGPQGAGPGTLRRMAAYIHVFLLTVVQSTYHVCTRSPRLVCTLHMYV